MIVKLFSEVERQRVETEGAENAWIRWLIGKDSPAPNFFLRLFEIMPGGHSPFHQHSDEHEIFVLEGEGYLKTEDNQTLPLKAGTFALILPEEKHQFVNASSNSVLKFLCIVPRKK